ncbi:MAG: hypothetical protein P8Y97_08465 [Candidatus Lokiarchaeota archaeon]
MVQNYQNIFNSKIDLMKDQQSIFKVEKSENWIVEKEILGKKVLELLYKSGAIKTWYRDKKDGWILNSGLWSPVYISLRPISSIKNCSELLSCIGLSLSKLIINEIPKFSKILGLATTGIQIATAISIYYVANKSNKNVKVNDVVVLIDREQGAKEIAESHEINLHSLIPFKSKLYWLKDKFSPIEYKVINEYLSNYSNFQNQEKINNIKKLSKN